MNVLKQTAVDYAILRKSRRAERERYQILCAKQRERLHWKFMPIRHRENAIKRSRDVKYAIEHQSGIFTDYAKYLTGCTAFVFGKCLKLAAPLTVFAHGVGAGYGSALIDVVQESFVPRASKTIFDSLKESFLSMLEEWKQNFIRVVGDFWIIPFTLLFSWIVWQTDTPVLRAALWGVFVTVVGMKYGPDLMRHIFAHLFKNASESEPFESQSGIGSLVGFVPLVLAVVSTVMGCGKPSDRWLDEFTSRFSRLGSTMEGFEETFDKLINLSESAINFVLKKCSLDEVSLTSVGQRALKKWMVEVDRFEAYAAANNTIPVSTLERALELQIQGLGFRSSVNSRNMRMLLDKSLDRLSLTLSTHRGVLSAADNFRQPPFWYMFGGGSAVGKTTLVKAFGSLVLLLAGEVSASDIHAQMWQKGTSEYFNGYNGQKVYVMDDAFQKKVGPNTTDDEFMTMIRAVGNWSMPLNYADLASKGRFYFNSIMILATTNVVDVKQLASTVVNCPEAVTRRISKGLWLEVHPDYKLHNGAINYDKLSRTFCERLRQLGSGTISREDYVGCYPWEAWVARKHTFDCPLGHTDIVCLKQLVMQAADDLRLRKRQHTGDLDMLNEFFEISKRVEVQSGLGGESCPSCGVWGLCPEHVPIRLQTSVAERVQTYEDLMEEIRAEARAPPEFQNWGDDQFVYPDFTQSEMKVEKALRWDQELYERVKATLCSMVGPSGIKVGLILAAAGAVASLAYVTYRSLARSLGFVIEAQSAHKPPTPLPVVKQARKPFQRFVHTGVNQSAIVDNCQKNIYANSYMLLGDMPDGSVQKIGQVQFLVGTTVCMPYHFLDEILSFGVTRLRFIHTLNHAHAFEMDPKVLLESRREVSEEGDIAFVRFEPGKICRAHRDITQYFLDSSQLESLLNVRERQVALDVARFEDGQPRRQTYTADSIKRVEELPVGQVVYKDLVSYSMPTQKGDCGAPLVIMNNTSFQSRCFIGLHIAGTVGTSMYRTGFATPITRGDVVAVLTRLGEIKDKMSEDLITQGILTDECDACVEAQGSFLPLCKLRKPVHNPTTTKLISTPVGDVELFGPCPVKPAHMTKFHDGSGFVYPMARAMENFQSPVRLGFIQNEEAVVQLAMKRHHDCTKDSCRDVLNFEAAVKGGTVAPYESLKLKKINPDASAGLAYKLRGITNKRQILGWELEMNNALTDELRERVSYVIESAKRGERLAHIYTDFLKDELRPGVKVDAGKTRSICGSPLDYLLAVRMYFGAYQASVFSHHTECGMAPGVNPYGDWWKLVGALHSNGKRKVFAGDFSRFDAAQQEYILQACLKYINRWYRYNNSKWTAEDDLVREVLFLDLVHSRHLVSYTGVATSIVQWNKSLPSGHPLTTIINSMFSLITLTACYVKRTGDLTGMWDHVTLITYGDDNVNSVDDATCDKFNQFTVEADMKELFDLVYTSDTKDAVTDPYTTIDNVTFLKRSFKRDLFFEGGWICPLDRGSFMYTPYYTKSKSNPIGQLQSDFDVMLGELSLYGDSDEWNKVYERVVSYTGGQIDLVHNSYQATREVMRSRTDVWY